MARRGNRLNNVLIQGLKTFGENGFEMRIRNIGNETFIASIKESFNTTENQVYKRNDDASGALYYVCAVIVIYGFGIILMIASVINKGKHDKSIYKYIADLDNLKRLEKRKEKFKTRLIMQKIQKKKIPFKTIHTAPQRMALVKDDESYPWGDVPSGQQTKEGIDEQFAFYQPLVSLKNTEIEQESDELCIIQVDENCEEEEEEEYVEQTASSPDTPKREENFDFV
ncbi:DgyrCDS8326 [Dimorphilus gyrociliatus]|uniref:DgyrCDS8326 n=1 Tax=Dimorphilus gyrociliatus TaxID=2664684 RepID=A0A7I8VU17_9ANNE|nr:DgyrCDS8326 [Dimorphilus gyrociliatus]